MCPVLLSEVDADISFSVQEDLRGDEGLYEFLTDDLEVRRSRIRAWERRNRALDLNLESDQDLIMRLYSKWVLDDLHIVLEKYDTTTDSSTWECHKARKRGNDVDAFRIRQRLKYLADRLEDYVHDENQSPGKPPSRTRALYVTLTYDPKKVDHDANEAWREIGTDWNLFLTRLRKRLGTPMAEVVGDEVKTRVVPARIHVVRSWESHESGMPHIHAILAFDDFHFRIFRDQKDRWRADRKDYLEDAWPHGFIDVQALTPGTLERRLEDVVWYVGKNLSDTDYRLVNSWPIKRRLTIATLWYLGKRAFSISRELAGQRDLTKRESIIQTTIDGRILEIPRFEWKFLGLCRRIHTDLSRDDWLIIKKEPPDWLDLCWKPYSHERSSAWDTWDN